MEPDEDEKDPDVVIAEDELEKTAVDRRHGNPGRPPKATEKKLTERITLTFTAEDMKLLIIEAANAEGGPLHVRKWCYQQIMKLVKK